MISENRLIRSFRNEEKKLLAQKKDLLDKREKGIAFFRNEKNKSMAEIHEFDVEIAKIETEYAHKMRDIDTIIGAKRDILHNALSNIINEKIEKHEPQDN